MKTILIIILSLCLTTSCGKKESSKVEIEETWKEIVLPESQNGENVAELTVKACINRAFESLVENNKEKANFYAKEANRVYKIYEKQLENRKVRKLSFKDFYFNELKEAVIKHPNQKETLTEFVELQTNGQL